MESLCKTYLHDVTDVVNCTIVRFFWSDKLLTAEDTTLERLKFAILFTIADVFCVKKQNKRMLSDDKKNWEQKFHSSFMHPSSFIHPCKIFIHLGLNRSPG